MLVIIPIIYLLGLCFCWFTAFCCAAFVENEDCFKLGKKWFLTGIVWPIILLIDIEKFLSSNRL